jgi:hypothetical protein
MRSIARCELHWCRRKASANCSPIKNRRRVGGAELPLAFQPAEMLRTCDKTCRACETEPGRPRALRNLPNVDESPRRGELLIRLVTARTSSQVGEKSAFSFGIWRLFGGQCECDAQAGSAGKPGVAKIISVMALMLRLP